MSGFKVESNVKAVKTELQSKVNEWLNDAGNTILDESNKVAPIDEGTLVNSGQVIVDTGSQTATIGYDTPYAVRQHEDISLQHKNGRSAKFLESAFKENTNRLQDELKRRLSG